jgi:hypothetical protein
MGIKHTAAVLTAILSLVIASLACGSSGEDDQLVRSLVAPTSEAQAQGTSAPQPTQVQATYTPAPTATSEIEGLVKEGTHLVGTDIQPGIYVGLAGDDILDSCYWARLSNLTGSDDILANDNAQGLYYVEVLPDDKALDTGCELLPIDKVPAREEFLSSLTPGTYLIDRDIEAGIYRGEAGTDILESCYWARLSSVSGEDDILANDNATGQFFIEVLPSDFALQVGCQVEKTQ